VYEKDINICFIVPIVDINFLKKEEEEVSVKDSKALLVCAGALDSDGSSGLLPS